MTNRGGPNWAGAVNIRWFLTYCTFICLILTSFNVNVLWSCCTEFNACWWRIKWVKNYMVEWRVMMLIVHLSWPINVIVILIIYLCLLIFNFVIFPKSIIMNFRFQCCSSWIQYQFHVYLTFSFFYSQT